MTVIPEDSVITGCEGPRQSHVKLDLKDVSVLIVEFCIMSGSMREAVPGQSLLCTRADVRTHAALRKPLPSHPHPCWPADQSCQEVSDKQAAASMYIVATEDVHACMCWPVNVEAGGELQFRGAACIYIQGHSAHMQECR